MTDWEDHLRHAYEVASRSPDPSTQNGAVALDASGAVVGVGFNGPPVGCDDVDFAELEREERLGWVVHAERAALYAAVRGGHHVSTLVAPWSACTECAKTIVNLGVETLVRHQSVLELTPRRWRGEIAFAEDMLYRADVEVYDVDGELGACEVLFDGELWTP